MKLIIDIPEEAYKLRLTNPVWYDSNMDKAIRNGTPLEEEIEKIKAEITQTYETNKYFGVEEHDSVIEIIDNHIAEMKGE